MHNACRAQKMANSHFILLAAVAERVFFILNRISDTQANSIEDYNIILKVLLCCNMISVRIYHSFLVFSYFFVFCEEFLENNRALTGE